jgi:signal transduction histidine kinase/AmiR/NasT family two-component response regulator
MRDEVSAAEQIRSLNARLDEAEETLRAVRSGEIDAFIVQGPRGEQVFALRSAEQPYRNLVEDMLEGAAILTLEGDIAYCNKRFAELVSVPLEDVVGGAMERFIAGPDRPLYRALLAAGSGKRRARLAAADGRAVDVLLSFTTSVTDEVERRNLIITDISELLVAQQQSQAKDEFMAMLAHELRNPLSAITAAVQVLEAAKGRESAAARARFIIDRQAQHLSRLVDDLLDVGRVVTGKIALDCRAIDFCDLVRRTAAVFTEREAEHLFSLNVVPAWIDGDAVRIEQVVSNIIGNAVKYTPVGGKVTISLSIEGEEAVLRVQDNGFGITQDLQSRIFDLFVQGERTLDRSQGGLDIGLTLVRRLVELHKGSVSVFSEGANRGSLFTVRLPKVAAVGASSTAGDAPRARSIQRRVVIIEDNRDAREMFRMMLELDGHQVLEAEEGVAGLQLLHSELPDVAFIDVGLPGLDGYEIARRFRAAAAPDASRVLLVALTGYGTPDALERSKCAGFDHHLIKPVKPEALYRLLNASESPNTASESLSTAATGVAAPERRGGGCCPEATLVQ